MYVVGFWLPVFDNRDGRCGSRFSVEPGLPAFETVAWARAKANQLAEAMYADVMSDGLGCGDMPEPGVLEILPGGSSRRESMYPQAPPSPQLYIDDIPF